MKKQLILFLLIACSFSCITQKKEVISKSTIKLEGKNTNIRDFMEIDGYYPCRNATGNYMFFEDGTWVYFFFKSSLSESEVKANMSKSVVSWMKNKQTRWGSRWGVYRIQNDTIVVYAYDKLYFSNVWSLSENRYKIINRNVVKRIYYRGILKADDSSYEFQSPWIYGTDLHFTPADSLPTADNWLKEEKWIWRNKSDWKQYMKEQKKMREDAKHIKKNK